MTVISGNVNLRICCSWIDFTEYNYKSVWLFRFFLLAYYFSVPIETQYHRDHSTRPVFYLFLLFYLNLENLLKSLISRIQPLLYEVSTYFSRIIVKRKKPLTNETFLTRFLLVTSIASIFWSTYLLILLL